MNLQLNEGVKVKKQIPNLKKESLCDVDYNYRKLIEGLPAAIYICDVDGKITFCNQAAIELWGKKPDIGKDLWCGSGKIYRTDGTRLPLDECPMAITLREGRLCNGEEIIIERPDGIRINVLSHPRPIFDAEGNIVGAVNLLVDITDKRKASELIHKSENKYRLLSETLEKKVEERTVSLIKNEERYHKMVDEVQDYAILLLDKDGRIVNWNKGAEKIKGYTEKEILGKNFEIFYLPNDRESKLPQKLIKEATETGKAMHEGWRVRKDGTRFWGSIVITALHDKDNNIIGFSKVTRDLTERKMAEDQLRQYARDIEFKNKQLEEYAYVASHDLQEPLRKIQTFTVLMEKNFEDRAAVKQYLDRIKFSAKRMSSLITDVLKYSQLSNSDDLFVPVDLTKIIEIVKQDYDLLIEEKHATINYTTLPVIKAIPVQMQQLFSNLLNNALKYSDKKPVIDISFKKLTEDEVKNYPQLNSNHSYVKIIFKDNGVGFEGKNVNKVFELFKRMNDLKPGTGIGLAICKKIVENHNGYITVTSEPNIGTEFSVFFIAE